MLMLQCSRVSLLEYYKHRLFTIDVDLSWFLLFPHENNCDNSAFSFELLQFCLFDVELAAWHVKPHEVMTIIYITTVKNTNKDKSIGSRVRIDGIPSQFYIKGRQFIWRMTC